MAKQTWNPGTAPTGVGGDTPYSANTKHQYNANELYAHCGADAAGNLPDAQPVTKGGTGATSAAGARTNLGINIEPATGVMRYKSSDGTKWIYISDVGGWGAYDGTTQKYIPYEQMPFNSFTSTSSGINFNNFTKTGLHTFTGTPTANASNSPPVRSIDTTLFGVLEVIESAGRVIQRWNNSNASAVAQYFRFFWGTAWTPWFVVYHGANTTVDSNGFIKAASPIVQLFADKIELNDEAQLQEIVFEKLGVGDYLIQGSSGFAQEGWYVEQPKDANGNVYHAVLFEALENGDLSIKTYNKTLDGNGNTVADLNSPVDIKENRFISIRLNELPTDSTAPMNPTIVDNEGHPAPTKYHQLVDGMWVISAENKELLEIELMAQMPKLTRRQFRLALVSNSYDLAAIEALIASIEDPLQRQIIQIEWQDSTVFERTSNSLNYMATLLELDRDQINVLWQQALLL